ncbi:glutathione s-transferase [Plakobranchus ocellatus]|uniref:Glutathione s-transferase n=1 Tax=Plakobranchus ocellatus TaxID=259542 RepID=A0AAV3Y0F3_9GAST|nr:glutathione s-transferase [Plakobranchus ocellatus]
MSPSKSSSKYKLYYFAARGRAEVTRLIFKAASIPFVDETFSKDQWPGLKSTMPTQTVPVLEMGGEKYPDSGAIVRWAARKFGLSGKTDGDQLRVEEALAGAEEVRSLFLSWFFGTDPQSKGELEEQLKQKATKFLGRWEALVKETRASQRVYTYMVGTSLTAADLAMLDILEQLSSVHSIDLNAFPKLLNNKATVSSLKPIKQYLETRAHYPF